jgi:hypothetical protein
MHTLKSKPKELEDALRRTLIVVPIPRSRAVVAIVVGLRLIVVVRRGCVVVVGVSVCVIGSAVIAATSVRVLVTLPMTAAAIVIAVMVFRLSRAYRECAD